MRPAPAQTCRALRALVNCCTIWAALGVMAPAVPVLAGDSELTITVDAADATVTTDAQGRAVFSCPGMQRLSATGEPDIPWQVLTIVLPPEVMLDTVAVRAEALTFEGLLGQWNVAPASPWATWRDQQQVIAWPSEKKIVDGKDTAIYGAAAFWPASAARLLNTGRLRKWNLAQVALPLLRYDPSSRALQRLVSGHVVVSFKKPGVGPAAMSPQRQAELTDRIGEDRVRRLAVNYADQAAGYVAADAMAGPQPQEQINPAAAAGYVIVTTSAIQAASTKLAAFVALKQSQGFEVSVITESAFGGGTGNTAAENIRNWLKAHYVTDNIEYVLLIGDPNPTTSAIPMKMLYPRGPTGTDVSAPSDVYYAELTGNWDLNANGNFGEYSGDSGAGGFDRFWEAIVGRIPYYGAIADLDYILQKTIDYQTQPAGSVGWRRSVALPMRDPDDWTGADWLGEQIKNSILSPAGWSWNRIYQADAQVTPPPETTPCTMTNVTNVWKNGAFGLMLWWTHGSATSALDVMNTTYAAQLNDGHPSFTFQCSCNNAYPEVTNNLCYTLLKKGAVCTLGDTRVSWYQQGQNSFNGSASNAGLAYEYASRLVTYNLSAGHAIFDVTMALSPSSDKQWMNFCEFSLDGDPSIYLIPRCGRRYVKADAAPGGDGQSWPTAYCDLQSALDEYATEIWVAAGTYKPDRGTGNRTACFGLTTSTAVYGGFAGAETSRDQRNPAANATILSGDLAGNDGPGLAGNAENSYNVLISRACDARSVLDGFTIRGGNANNSSGGIQDRGAGLYNYTGSCPAINNCAFTGNFALTAGGAVYNQAGGTSPTFVNCMWTGNSCNGSGGAMSCQTKSRTCLTNCWFVGNSSTSYGGALDLSSDYVALADCSFTGNAAKSGAGGAIRLFSSNATLVNCSFLGNAASTRGGAVYNDRGSPTLTNCVFSGNTAASGGAMYCYDTSAPKLTNCTLVQNVATSTYSGGGGLYDDYNSAPIVTNCIIWANRDLNGMMESSQITINNLPPAINYSCVQSWTGSLGGDGNQGNDPLFIDADGPDNAVGTADDNLRLGPGSSCIDAGQNTAVPSGVVTDLNERPRFLDDPATPDCRWAPGTCGAAPIVDTGAYEFTQPPPGDADGDGDVDGADLARFESCVSGPSVPHSAGCGAWDFDHDTDVDGSDFGVFQRCYSGPSVPADPDCEG